MLTYEQSEPGERIMCSYSGKGTVKERHHNLTQVLIEWDAVIDKDGNVRIVDPPHACWRSVFFLDPEKK